MRVATVGSVAVDAGVQRSVEGTGALKPRAEEIGDSRRVAVGQGRHRSSWWGEGRPRTVMEEKTAGQPLSERVYGER